MAKASTISGELEETMFTAPGTTSLLSSQIIAIRPPFLDFFLSREALVFIFSTTEEGKVHLHLWELGEIRRGHNSSLLTNHSLYLPFLSPIG